MKQLQEELDNLINKEITVQIDGEVKCRKIRTTLFEILQWVNESAKNNGANYLIDCITYDLSSVQTAMPQMRMNNKPIKRRTSAFTSSNVMIHSWFSLQKDIIKTFEEFEKMYNITY